MVKTTHKSCIGATTPVNHEQRDLCFNLLVKYVTDLHPWSRLFTSILSIFHMCVPISRKLAGPYCHLFSVCLSELGCHLHLKLHIQAWRFLSYEVMGFNFHFSFCQISQLLLYPINIFYCRVKGSCDTS